MRGDISPLCWELISASLIVFWLYYDARAGRQLTTNQAQVVLRSCHEDFKTPDSTLSLEVKLLTVTVGVNLMQNPVMKHLLAYASPCCGVVADL